MAISIAQGFKVSGQESIDTRIVLTKAEMLAKLKGEMPQNYFCICKDDGKLYVWNSAFDKDPVLGRFRSYEEIMNIANAVNAALADTTPGGAGEQIQKAIADTVAKAMADPESEVAEKMTESISKTIPGALEDTMSTAEGAQKVANALFNDEHFQVNLENKIDLSLDVITAIGNVEE